ncbi:aspartate-semialdehyde dehydrogenase [Methanocorpusculum parvum]|uniref:aspartate-semialdehyde dehydrogenase n=1 Tax=Methanocorpusculum parvum TaxID=2193 RepID=A0AAX0Q655_9EURY|nr:aspartate-semialdehyde dehydrogenase [Methanocorpusculum parvum]NLC91484.1 aspartate-semialdehyde dehydrogenase [Methanocorpusculum parvum]PAV08690.1 aspartate-semialdehyde dehydrogenase [Methanocorpusculum parvum]
MINVGVLGATGAVGQRFVQLLADHPWFNLTTLTASERSAGKPYGSVVNWRLDSPFPDSSAELIVAPTTVDAVKDCDVVFSALPADIAAKLETDIADAGVGVCSNASSHRMEADVPLMIAEVNPEHAALIDVQRKKGRDGFIVTNPNCSTIMLATALAPLRKFSFTNINVATMQAISGAGFEGVPAFSIYDNVIPYIGSEEEKMSREANKILGTLDGGKITGAPFSVSASCNRVPVIDGHTLNVWIDIKATPAEVIEAFKTWQPPFSGLPTQPDHTVLYLDQENRPQPRLDRNRGNAMTVSVGRVREGIRFVAMGHNTIRGAAGASVLNAELLHTMKYI